MYYFFLLFFHVKFYWCSLFVCLFVFLHTIYTWHQSQWPWVVNYNGYENLYICVMTAVAVATTVEPLMKDQPFNGPAILCDHVSMNSLFTGPCQQTPDQRLALVWGLFFFFFFDDDDLRGGFSSGVLLKLTCWVTYSQNASDSMWASNDIWNRACAFPVSCCFAQTLCTFFSSVKNVISCELVNIAISVYISHTISDCTM